MDFFDIIVTLFYLWGVYCAWGFLSGRTEWLDQLNFPAILTKLLLSFVVGYGIFGINVLILMLKIIALMLGWRPDIRFLGNDPERTKRAQRFDGKGIFRNADKGGYDGNGNWQEPGRGRVDGKGYYREPGEGGYDGKGYWREPGEGGYDGEGKWQNPSD